jgi:DnaJ domain
VKQDRFHGRIGSGSRDCDWSGCGEPGEFRAPGPSGSSFDGPGDWFEGMSADEILAAQHPIHGWDRQTRAFSPTAGIDSAPRWADYADPLEAISQRARAKRPAQRADGKFFNPDERKALDVLGLDLDSDRRALRKRYSELVHALHPDRNGGDRSSEKRLQAVVEAYQLLRKAAVFR